MTQSIFTQKYDVFKTLLTEYRKKAAKTQQNLADILDKPQSYVSKYESGERRLDLIEFLDVAEALEFDTSAFIEELKRRSL